jgi:hypothetical protein
MYLGGAEGRSAQPPTGKECQKPKLFLRIGTLRKGRELRAAILSVAEKSVLTPAPLVPSGGGGGGSSISLASAMRSPFVLLHNQHRVPRWVACHTATW